MSILIKEIPNWSFDPILRLEKSEISLVQVANSCNGKAMLLAGIKTERNSLHAKNKMSSLYLKCTVISQKKVLSHVFIFSIEFTAGLHDKTKKKWKLFYNKPK